MLSLVLTAGSRPGGGSGGSGGSGGKFPPFSCNPGDKRNQGRTWETASVIGKEEHD